MLCSFPCRGNSQHLLSLFLLFEFFEAVVNLIIFLYSYSICSLLVHRKATDFCGMILYPATFLKLLLVPTSVLVEFFGSLLHKIRSSTNKE
jgi:hypothetical protein